MSVYLANQPDPAALEAALRSEVIHAILLLELRFASGTRYLSNSLIEFTDPLWGHVWHGAGNLVSMSDVAGGPDDLAPYRQYSLGIPWELLRDDERGVNGMGMIPGLIGDRADYVNRPAVLWEQVFSTSSQDAWGRAVPLGHPTALHFGLMDRVEASYSATAAVLTLSVEGPLARKGAPVFGMLTPRDQARRHPGDKGLDYVPEVQSTNPIWTDW